MKTYIRSLISGATLMALGVHFIEDVGLISIGRWLPMPWWAVYLIGIGFSAGSCGPGSSTGSNIGRRSWRHYEDALSDRSALVGR